MCSWALLSPNKLLCAFTQFLHDLQFKPPLAKIPMRYRGVLDILENSLGELSFLPSSSNDGADAAAKSSKDDVHNAIHNEVRYKLIIDPSEDDSLMRLLFSQGVLQRDNTRVYICSDFPEDSHLRVSAQWNLCNYNIIMMLYGW